MNGSIDNSSGIPIYIGTVCLEKNRWGSKTPSFKVSEWAERFKADGFDGIELWANHYLLADEAEQEALANAALPISIYNSYIGFTDDDSEAHMLATAAVSRLGAPALKYNLGGDAGRLAEYRRNLLAWADTLPADCRLLCECHQGTVLETPEAAATFHADLDPYKFGVMIHPSSDPVTMAAWFDACGDRISHLHIQRRTPDTDPSTSAGRASCDACMALVKAHSFQGGMTIEFTRGIGREEDINTLYANACIDLNHCRESI